MCVPELFFFFTHSSLFHATYLSSPSGTITQLFVVPPRFFRHWLRGIRVAFTFFSSLFFFDASSTDNRRGLSDIWISIPMFHRRAAILNRDFLSTTGISLSPRCAIVTPLFKRSIDFSLVKISPRGWLMMLICISRSSIDSIICNSQFFFFFPFGGRKTRETRTPLRNVGPRIVKTHRSFDSKKKTLFFREKREQKFQHESSNLRGSKFEIFFKLDLII